jgi:Holliday junction resolvasome RuvABC ATP-dependent DNA helicase subunit
MNSEELINTYIVGQQVWKRTFNILLLSLKEGDNSNILIIGPSGYGKTYIGTLLLNWAIKHGRKESVGRIICNGRDLISFGDSAGYLIDEAHKLPTPEHIYGDMDNRNKALIFTTNVWGELPQPLVNRCIPIQLVEYSLIELGYIAKRYFLKRGIVGETLPVIYEEIARRCRGVPRTAKKIAEMLLLGHPKSYNLFSTDLEDVFQSLGIFKDGFRPYDYNYLKSLEMAGGRAGLQTLASLTSFDRDFICNEIEPFLIKKNLIQITPRGRIKL